MRVCDMCGDKDHQPVSRASIHVKGKSGGALDICDGCLDSVAENRSPARRLAALNRGRPYGEPRELTDSAALGEEGR